MPLVCNNPIVQPMRLSASLLLILLLAACGGGGGGGSTEDVIAPTVASFTPAEGMTNVPNNAVLSITFDEALDASTLTSSSFSLSGSSGVMGTVAYDANTNTASFTPDAPLELDVLHTATLTTSITDSAGNPLAAVFSLTFTTETFIQRMSVASDGTEGMDGGYEPSISAGGRYVAFVSSADNLLGAGNDANVSDDIYVRDTQTNTTTRVSVANDGSEANNESYQGPSISADGRYIAFLSSADNLLGAGSDTNNRDDIFVRDTQTNTTTRVSVANDGSEANGRSTDASISDDGRYVAFESSADNLLGTGNDTNGIDIFVRDTQGNTTIRVSVANDGSEAEGNSSEPSISEDGRYVAFTSFANNLLGAGNDTNNQEDIFVRDTQTNTTTRVSVANDGSEAVGNSSGPSISEDGRYVAFTSFANNLLGAGNDTNNQEDIFVRDTQANTTTRVSVANDGSEAVGISLNASISEDGRYVVFASTANNLLGAGNDTIGRDIFVRDTQTNTTARVSVATDGSEANFDSYNPSLSADGRYVAFESNANNLLGAGNDSNGYKDIFRTLTTPPTPPPVIVSDRRLKKDIVYLASLENGIKLYAFKYLWSGEVYVGVMAQDLLKMPAFSHAVHLMQGNFYAVDYQALGLKMIPKSMWSESTDNVDRTSPAAT